MEVADQPAGAYRDNGDDDGPDWGLIGGLLASLRQPAHPPATAGSIRSTGSSSAGIDLASTRPRLAANWQTPPPTLPRGTRVLERLVAELPL